MSVSDRLDNAGKASAEEWRRQTRSLSWTGLLVSLALMAAGIACATLIHAAVGIPLVVIALIVLYKSGFVWTGPTVNAPSND